MKITNNSILEINYEINWELFQNGNMNRAEWSAYCEELLERFLGEHTDLLIRLKNI